MALYYFFWIFFQVYGIVGGLCLWSLSVWVFIYDESSFSLVLNCFCEITL